MSKKIEIPGSSYDLFEVLLALRARFKNIVDLIDRITPTLGYLIKNNITIDQEGLPEVVANLMKLINKPAFAKTLHKLNDILRGVELTIRVIGDKIKK